MCPHVCVVVAVVVTHAVEMKLFDANTLRADTQIHTHPQPLHNPDDINRMEHEKRYF